MSDLSDSGAGDFAAAVCPMSAPATAVHLAASVVPPLLTKSGRLRIDVTPQSGNAIVVIAPSPSIRQTLQIGQSRQSSFIKLRL